MVIICAVFCNRLPLGPVEKCVNCLRICERSNKRVSQGLYKLKALGGEMVGSPGLSSNISRQEVGVLSTCRLKRQDACRVASKSINTCFLGVLRKSREIMGVR